MQSLQTNTTYIYSQEYIELLYMSQYNISIVLPYPQCTTYNLQTLKLVKLTYMQIYSHQAFPQFTLPFVLSYVSFTIHKYWLVLTNITSFLFFVPAVSWNPQAVIDVDTELFIYVPRSKWCTVRDALSPSGIPMVEDGRSGRRNGVRSLLISRSIVRELVTATTIIAAIIRWNSRTSHQAIKNMHPAYLCWGWRLIRFKSAM